MPNFPLDEAEVNAFIDAAFAEDIGSGDITANTIIPPEATLSATMNAREVMTVAGLPLLAPIIRRLDPDAEIQCAVSDGTQVKAGDTIATISGNARALLSAERTALNIIQHMSGIATLTRTYADKIAGTNTVLLDTRKTTPGLRKLDKYATACGGAHNHRMGLFDAVMIKDNHIAVAGSIQEAVQAALDAGHSKIQVECDTLEQVQEAITAGANSLLLDNMNPARLTKALAIVGGAAPCEASGGVTLDTIRAIAETGVDYISVGRLTQSAPAVDIGLDFAAC